MSKKADIILEICAQLAEEEQLQLTIMQSAKGAGISGIASLIGGLLGGRKGLLLGGVIGSAASYYMAPDFKSIPNIIREDMTESQKRKLCKQIGDLFGRGMITNVSSTMKLLSKNEGLKSNVVSVLTNFIQQDLGLGSL